MQSYIGTAQRIIPRKRSVIQKIMYIFNHVNSTPRNDDEDPYNIHTSLLSIFNSERDSSEETSWEIEKFTYMEIFILIAPFIYILRKYSATARGDCYNYNCVLSIIFLMVCAR